MGFVSVKLCIGDTPQYRSTNFINFFPSSEKAKRAGQNFRSSLWFVSKTKPNKYKTDSEVRKSALRGENLNINIQSVRSTQETNEYFHPNRKAVHKFCTKDQRPVIPRIKFKTMGAMFRGHLTFVIIAALPGTACGRTSGHTPSGASRSPSTSSRSSPARGAGVSMTGIIVASESKQDTVSFRRRADGCREPLATGSCVSSRTRRHTFTARRPKTHPGALLFNRGNGTPGFSDSPRVHAASSEYFVMVLQYIALSSFFGHFVKRGHETPPLSDLRHWWCPNV